MHVVHDYIARLYKIFKNWILKNWSKYTIPFTVHVERPSCENGVVLTCGMGDVGQLGLGEDVEEKTRPGLVPDLENIVAVAAGGLHSVVLDKDGKVG